MYEGTAIISGKRGQFVLTDGSKEEHLSKRVYNTHTKTSLRYSQVRSTIHVVSITQLIHTYTNIPRLYRWTCSKKWTPKQISLHKLICALPPVPSTTSNSLQRGSANTTYLFQQTKALLNPTSLMKFLEDNIKTMFVYMWYYPMYVCSYISMHICICMQTRMHKCMHMSMTRIKVQVHTKENYLNFDSLCRLSREILPTQKFWIVKNQVCMSLSELKYIHTFLCIKIPKYHRWWAARLP